MDNKTGSFSPPEFQDKRVAPPGILPKNMQVRLLGGVAAVMFAVIAFSAQHPPKERVTSQSPTAEVIDPNAVHIQEFQKSVEEQSRKLRLEQDALGDNQQAGGLLSEVSSSPVEPTPFKGKAPASKAFAEESPDQNRVQSHNEKPDDKSLFASNVALTYRNQNATSAETTAATRKNLQERAEPLTGESEKQQFGKSQQQETLPSGEQKQLYRLVEGTVIETVLTNRLDGAFSGPVNCMVTTNVYSSDGQHLLIPQGSRVLGEVHKVETFGQQRLTVAFHRLIMPNGFSLSLDQFHGLNQIGETGLRDQVNHHYLQVFGISLAIGAIAGLAEANVNMGATTAGAGTGAYEQGVASSLSQSSLRILDRYLNVVPTFTIREGHRVKIYMSADLALPIYEGDRNLE